MIMKKNPHGNNDSSSSSTEEEEEGGGDDLSQQLQTLQSMIPNMIRADKRSVLEETHSYLQRIQEETERIEKELSQRSNTSPSSSSSSSNAEGRPKILSMEIEELMEGRFVVKIRWRRGSCVGVTAGHVQRVIEECVDVTMTSILHNDNNPDQMLTTAFVKVKDEMKMTEEELHDHLMNAAARFGLILP